MVLKDEMRGHEADCLQFFLFARVRQFVGLTGAYNNFVRLLHPMRCGFPSTRIRDVAKTGDAEVSLLLGVAFCYLLL
jgi:hypothetical protein